MNRKNARGRPYHLTIAEPQVNPAPKATKTVLDPSFMAPLFLASSKAMGTDAAEVFP